MGGAAPAGTPRPLVGEEREWEEHGDPAEEMRPALSQPVGGDREREPADGGGAGRELELPQPAVGEEPRGDDRPQEEEVPRHDRAEDGVERPESESERPAGENDLGIDERLEAVRVDPRRPAVGQLVADEPEAVDGLKMVAGRGLAVAVGSVGDEGAEEVEAGRERGDDGRADVEGYESERADSTSMSKSDTSDAPYRHAPRIMPSPSTTKAALRATSGSPRKSCTISSARTASPVQSERRGTWRSSACCHATCDQGLSREMP